MEEEKELNLLFIVEKKPTIRQRLGSALFRGKYSWITEVVLAFVSLVWAVLYITGTYLFLVVIPPAETPSQPGEPVDTEYPPVQPEPTYDFVYPPYMQYIDYAFASFFAIVFILRAVTAESLRKLLLSPYSLIDYITIIPAFIAAPVFSSLRVLAVLRLFKVFRILHLVESRVARQASKIFFTIIAVIVVGACMILTIEPTTFKNFHSAVYFMVVSLTTVGYGDLHPVTTGGRVVIMLIILTTLVLVPMQAFILSRLVNEAKTPYDIALLPNRNKTTLLVLCTGAPDTQTLQRFVEEYMKRYGHRREIVRIAIMAVGAPPPEIEYIRTSTTISDLVYLNGNPLVHNNIKRLLPAVASAAVILLNPTSSPDENDRDNAFLTLMVRSFNEDLPITVYIRDRDNESLFFGAGLRAVADRDLILTILGRCVEVPGLSTLLLNLFRTVDPHDAFSEYEKGTCCEVYMAKLPDTLIGKTFAEATRIIYSHIGAIMGSEPAFFIARDWRIAQSVQKVGDDTSLASSNLRGLGEQELRYMRKSKEFEPRHPTRKIKAAKLSRRKHYKFVSEAPQYSSLTTESFYETRFKEMVITNLDGISNHILIFGSDEENEPGDILPCIFSLRHVAVKTHRNIVMVFDVKVTIDLIRPYAHFDKVFAIHIPSLNQFTDKILKINEANAAIIASGSLKPNPIRSDRDAMLTYSYLKYHHPDLKVIFELHDIASLKATHTQDQRDPFCLSEVKRGVVVSHCFVHRLVADSVYNPFFIELVYRLASWNEDENNPNVVGGVNLISIKIPIAFRQRTFKELFDHLIEAKQWIAIGLYKYSSDGYFVYTSPEPDMLLQSKDYVFVITSN